MGLFNFIEEHPEHVIVLDDISSLFKSDQAMQMLLAALDGDPASVRRITYKSKDGEKPVLFTGGVIAISNIPMRCDPLARALGSRIVCYEHEPSDEEIAAYMRQLAQRGFSGLTVDECLEVAEFVIAETRESDLRLDLRHFNKALRDFRQHKEGRSQTPWSDLVRTSLMRFATEAFVPLSKRDEIELQRQKVRDALQKYPDDTQAQIEATNLGKSTFYTRKKEVLAESNAA